MTFLKKWITSLSLLLLLVALNFNAQAQQTSVHAVALFNGKAMLSIDGGRAKIIQVGQTLKGVKLLAADTSEATVEINGKRELLTLNSTVLLSGTLGASAPANSDSLQLWADERGFFRSGGAINGRQLEFLVDTGANLVVLSSVQANRIGLEYRNGIRGMASTASGTAPMYVIEAREVSLGGIQLDSIEAGVIEGNFPEIPLLGMSFLERVDMNRSGNMMVLKKRY
jgi:aspartyl protease family protein